MPLLIKAPGQRTGRIDDAFVETTDILPTIFDLLNLDPRVQMDGRSAFSPEVRDRDGIRWLVRNNFNELHASGEEFLQARRRVVERNTRLLGIGRDGAGRLYRVGPHQELIGQPASAAGPALGVELVNGSDYENVDLESSFVPIHIVAKVKSGGGPPRDIAVAVNGTIRAVGNTFRLATGAGGELVSVLVPPDALRRGRNEVQVSAGSVSSRFPSGGGVAVSVCAALLVSACGEGEAPRPDREEVRDVLVGFFEDAANEDGEAVCGALNGVGRAQAAARQSGEGR